jgi:flagellin-specific chaperone FliS
MALIIINNFNILAEQLLAEGKVVEAKKTLEKCQEVVPDKLYSMSFAVRTYFTADLLYKVGEIQKANALISKVTDYVSDELRYFIAIEKDKPNAASNDIQLGFSILNEALRGTNAQGQKELNARIQKQFTDLQSSLSPR